MTDYTITTDFGAKDSLPSGNAAKVIKGSEFTAEFTNIQTAVNTKADTAGDTFTGAVTFDAAVTVNSTATITGDLTVDTNTLFVDVSENKVGIGTTSPAYPLDVTGSAQLSGGDLILRSDSDNADTQYIRFENYPSDIRTAYIRADYTSQTAGGGTALAFGANDHATATDTDSMVIDIEGNVGIGTDSPDRALHVSTADNLPIFAESTDDLCLLGLGDNAGTVAIAASGSSFGVYTGGGVGSGTGFGTEKMRIDSSGNVGIGTTSPDVKLDVTEAYDTVANVLSNGSYAAKFSSSGSGDTGRTQGILLSGANANTRGVALLAEAQSDNNAHDFVIATSASTSTPTERLRIDSSGNVGIGTDSPSQKLDVAGSIRANNLNVDGGSNRYIFITSSDGLGECELRLGDVSDTDAGSIAYNNADNSMQFRANAAERMRIDSTGNVGIGTSSPQAKLEVNGGTGVASTGGTLVVRQDGDTDSDGIALTSSNATSHRIWKDSSGKLNIGPSNLPSALVQDLSGNVLVGKTTSSLNTTGIQLQNDGLIRATKNNASVLQLNRQSSDGDIVNFYKDGTTVGSIGVANSDNLYIQGDSSHSGLSFGTNELLAYKNGGYVDNTLNIGSTTFRFKDLYRSGSTYSTSDRNKKQDIRDLTDAEARVAVVAKGSLKAFRYIDTVEAEGDDANIHFGIIAQDLKAAFEAEGLNADSYQVLKTSTYTDDDGVEQTTYSVCYENLLAFIISAI